MAAAMLTDQPVGDFTGTQGYEETDPSSGNIRLCQIYRFTFSVVIIGTLCVVGTAGNLLALVVLQRFRESDGGGGRGGGQRGATALILSALAVVDALVLVSLLLVKSLPSLFWFANTGQTYLAISPYLWQWGWPLNDLFHAFSTWITVLVAAQRCVAVMFPHRAHTLCSYTITWGLLAFVITLVTLFQLPTFLDYHLVEITDGANKTSLVREFTNLGRNEVYHIAYKTTAYYFVIYILPLILLAILSFLLIRTLRKAQSARSNMTSRDSKLAHKEDDITRSLILVVIICMLCQPWEPVRRLMESLIMGQPGCGHFYFYYEEFPSLSFAINSSVNFVIYCLSGRKFRGILRQICCRTNDNQSLELSNAGNVTPEAAISGNSNFTSLPA